LDVRVGLHTGECELIDGKIAGIGVHIGARVAAKARRGEVLVSSTVKDLVAGSGLRFEDCGAHHLAGIPGEWRLYSVVNGCGSLLKGGPGTCSTSALASTGVALRHLGARFV
jgi:class 3 adenylate cyclase